MSDYTDRVRHVVCVTCGADRGQSCRTLRPDAAGVRRHVPYLHRARHERAQLVLVKRIPQ